MAKRRGHGEGSIYQRSSDGLWVGSLNLGWVDGKRKRKYVYGKTQADVREQLARFTSDRDRGFAVPTARVVSELPIGSPIPKNEAATITNQLDNNLSTQVDTPLPIHEKQVRELARVEPVNQDATKTATSTPSTVNQKTHCGRFGMARRLSE